MKKNDKVFIQYTLDALEQYRDNLPKGQQNYSRTLFLNACLGLLIIPRVSYYDNLPVEDIKDDAQSEDNEKYDYIVDLKAKSATLTQKGVSKAEREFNLENLNDIENSDLVHNITQALKAHGVMKKDIDYIVKDGEILIVDEFTGRIMYGRRYNGGLHQAIEAKEGVKIADDSKTLAKYPQKTKKFKNK